MTQQSIFSPHRLNLILLISTAIFVIPIFYTEATIDTGIALSSVNAFAQTTQVQYLSGTGNDDTVDWEFMVSGGRNSGQWATIPVPSNWEMQGFGTHHYYEDWSNNRAPDSVGYYRYRFPVPRGWQEKKIDLVFGGAMTDTEVKINGRLAGPAHQGGFYQFRYDITGLLRYGRENLLEVKVAKFSSNTSINRAERQADYWLFGGIFRPVWLEAFPLQHLERIAIGARHWGAFTIDIFLDNITSANFVMAQIRQLDGTPVGATFSATIKPGQEQVTLRTKVAGVKPWSPEWPNRYRVQVRLGENNKTLHEITEIFGFRTVEVRPQDGLYVNGVKVRLKGVNRHSFWQPPGARRARRSASRT
jgi:beta-galactosidase/beta-glucuronidase